MKHRVLEGVLLLIALLGGVLALQTGRQQSRLRGEHERLSKITGELPIADASKVYVRALETGERLHFAWRVYLPPNYKLHVRHRSGAQSSWRSDACQFIARVRFRENEQGQLQVYTSFSGGSGCTGLGDRPLAELLHDHWDQIRVDQLGANELVVIEPDRSVVFLRLTLADELRDASRDKLRPWIQEQFIPTLFEVELGPKASNP